MNIAVIGVGGVVDADLKDYFTTIHHGAQMNCIAPRVCDRTILSLIERWLEVPVIEQTERRPVCSRQSMKTHRGIIN